MKSLFLTIALFFHLNNCFSQTEHDTTSLPVGILNVTDSINAQIEVLNVDPEVPIPDSIYLRRLSELPFQFSMTYNPTVRRYIEVYTVKIKDKLQVMLGLSDFYFPIFDEVLKEYNLPNELKYIPIIESALNPKAVSRANAVGLWQFMRATGKENGLTINNYVDERRALTASTKAAALHLKSLYNTYHDWQLVLAAYNCGPGNVNKAIRRAGGKRNFWQIYRYLPRETRGYVPEFIAAAYAFNYCKEHNIDRVSALFPTRLDTIVISKNLHLQQVSNVLSIAIDTLRLLNPQYLRDIVPVNEKKPYVLIIPWEQKLRFTEQRDSIYSFQRPLYLTDFESNKIPISDQEESVIHRVRPGENLSVIAQKYRVTVTNIKKWNRISGTMIRAGQRLIIHRSPRG